MRGSTRPAERCSSGLRGHVGHALHFIVASTCRAHGPQPPAPSPLRRMDRLTARQLFDAVCERLSLRWLAGLRGEQRAIETGDTLERRPSLVGYLNIIYPNKVQ